jgi:competence protein ComEA
VGLTSLTPAQRRLAAALALLVVLLVVAWPRLSHAHRAAPALPPLRVASRAHAAPARRLVVDVAGAVGRPGLYRLAAGTRIADAVAAAGGATRKAELSAVNLAAPLADGEQVLVPARGAGGAAGVAPGSPTAPVDLNSASIEQLDALPGIGPATAEKILAYRQEHGPFTSVEELDGVPGIGPARIAQLKGLVVP